MDLSVLIVNWNTRDLLGQCLRSMSEVQGSTSGPQNEIIVVDNGSTDGSPDMLREEFPNVVLMQNTTNLGFAAANNQALSHVQGDFVLLLNPDTEVCPGAMETMMAFLRSHQEVGAVGPLLLNTDGSWQASALRFYGFWHSLIENRLVARFRRPPLPPAENRQVDWVTGAALMIRRDALEAVGSLDEQFFMYGEEIDWQMRLHQAGYQVYLLPGARVIHHGGQASRQARREAMWHDYRGRHLLLVKHYSTVPRVAFDLKTCLGLAFWTVAWQLRAWLAAGNNREWAHEWSSAYGTTLNRYGHALFTGEWHLDVPIDLPRECGSTGGLLAFANQPEQQKVPAPRHQDTEPGQQPKLPSNSSLPHEDADVK